MPLGVRPSALNPFRSLAELKPPAAPPHRPIAPNNDEFGTEEEYTVEDQHERLGCVLGPFVHSTARPVVEPSKSIFTVAPRAQRVE